MANSHQIKPCKVVLNQIDVSEYRNVQVPVTSTFNRAPIPRNVIVLQHVQDADDAEEVDSVGEGTAAAAFLVLAASLMLTEDNGEKNNKNHKPRRFWVNKWLEKRQSDGAYMKLLQELRFGENMDRVLYRSFLRMTHENFIELLEMVDPLIRKKDTKFRMSISPGERLAITLHYLATGSSFHSLQFLFRIPQCTISKIIPEVLDAIWMVLKNEFIRVNIHTINFAIYF